MGDDTEDPKDEGKDPVPPKPGEKPTPDEESERPQQWEPPIGLPPPK